MMNVGPAFFGAGGSSGGSDPLFANVVLLLHGNGTNGSTTITNSASVAQTYDIIGGVSIATAQSKFGGASIVFDGAADVLRYTANTTLDLTTADFCLEAHVRMSLLGSSCIIFDNSEGSYYNTQIWYNPTTNTFGARGFSSGLVQVYSLSSPTLVVNTWYHVALSRQGSIYRFFLDGVLVGSQTVPGAMYNAAANRLCIGAYAAGTFSLNGYVDEVRLTKGAARYTANFTPPIAPHPDS